MSTAELRRRRRASSPPTAADQSTLTSSNIGWPVNIPEIFEAIYHILCVGCATLYSGFWQGAHDMVQGISRLFGLRTGLTTGSSGGIQGEDGEDGVPLVQTKKREENVKRRRRTEAIDTSLEHNGHFPGMVNLSGTLCYMNSVLQAFASIPALLLHLERIIALAVEFDVPTPVADTLLDVLQDLNTPHSRPRRPIRPQALLAALRTLPAVGRLLGTREQQDAHELFLVLAEAVSVESLKVASEVARSKGLGEILSLSSWAAGKSNGTGLGKEREKMRIATRARVKRQRGLAQPWQGLMARRRVCRVCGWCEAVRMEPLGGMELSLPQNGDVTLDACIGQYLSPELLTGVTCEMCSLRRTHAHYQAEVDRLSVPGSSSSASISKSIRPGSGSFGALEDLRSGDLNSADHAQATEMTPARKKRAKEARKVEARLRGMLESGTISHFGEPALPPAPSSGNPSAPVPVKWQKAQTDSVRSGLITRPPQTLRLHLIRSEYTPYGALLKKSARVAFPVVLDLTRFVTRGIWEERTGVMTALASAELNGEKGAGEGMQTRLLYRLESVILHYGYTHSSGHYVCIRRKPRPRRGSIAHADTSKDGPDPFRPDKSRKSCPDACTCESCLYFGQVREEHTVPGRGWLRVSDDEVEEVGEEALIACRNQVFMLFYERVGEYEGSEGDGQARKLRLGSQGQADIGQRAEANSEGRRTPDSGIDA